MKLFDPPPSKEEYEIWDRTATRPLTDLGLGTATIGRRSKCSKLSALMLGRERPRRRVVKSPWTGQTYLVP